MPFGLPADGNPGAAVSFGERSRRHGPRARGGAEPGRGPRGGRGRLESRGLGRLGLRAPQGHRPGPSWAPWPAGNPHPRPRARAPSPLPISSPVRSPHLRLPPPRRGQVPSPSAWLRSPWNFSEERLLRKEAKGTKTQRGRGGSERGRYYWPRPPVRGPWALPSLTPSGSRWFKVILRAPHPTTTPRAAADPGTAASNHTHTQRASPKPWSWHSRPSTACSGQLLSFVSCLLLPSRLSCCALHLLSLMPETSLCWALPSAGRGASAKVDPSVLTSSVQQIFIQTAWDHAQVRDCRHAACPLSLRSLSIKCNHETV